MSNGGFVVTGTRPPSALSNYQPQSTRSKQGYHILARKSSVDELLFRSHHSARLDETISNFKAPWEYPKPQPPHQTFGHVKHKVVMNSKPQGRPLLWSPAPGSAIYSREKARSKSSLGDTDCLWSTRDHFRHLRHTPSFVDEALFGQRLKEATFEAPWNVRKNLDSKRSFDNVDQNGTLAHAAEPVDFAGDTSKQPQPSTALGISTSRRKISSVVTSSKPVWKP